MKNIIKPLRIIAASILILTGIIGLVIPIFPTVPFLAAAAVVLGKKPSEVIHFIKWINKKIKLWLKRILRKIRKKFNKS